MHITIGSWCDGHAWPDHGGGPAGSLGHAVVGPAGLVDLLEGVYGLGAPAPAEVERTAAWQRALEAADDGRRFWSRSLQADAWSTARLLLGWRDRLVDAGWDPTRTYDAKRLRDLAAAEGAAADLPRGLADRLRALAAELQDEGTLPLPLRLRLIEPRSDLAPGLRRLIDALETAGADVERHDPTPAAPPDTSLGRLQRHLLEHENARDAATPDGTVVILRGSSTLLAGEVLADQLLAPAGPGATALIAPPQDGVALDEAFARRAAARTGATRPSPHRGALQVLRLAFQTAWSPLDVRALLDLLLLDAGPIPGWVGRRLADALERAPGIGGAPWNKAWTTIEATLDGDDAAQHLETWRSWTEPAGADPIDGLPLPDAVAICDRVAAWATGRYGARQDPLFLAAAQDAAAVRAALTRLDRPRVPKALIDRIVDQALDAGRADPSAVEEAASWHRVTHPGALWSPADTVVWWDFRDGNERPPRSPWTRAERDELATHGAEPDDDARAARALATAWERAVLNARGRLILVAAGLDAHGEDGVHPLQHRIAPVASHLVASVRLEDALHAPDLAVAGTRHTRVPVPVAEPPRPVVTWPAPDRLVDAAASRRQSASSLEHLMACQLQWALRDVARLRPGGAAELPEGDRLLGNLAHEMAANLFDEGPPPDPQDVRTRATALLEQLLPRSAAPLLRPENAVDLVRARRHLPEALATLAEVLADNRLTVVAREAWTEARPPGAPHLGGFIDLATRDPDGRPVMVDLKWTRSRTHRAKELEDGEAIQLATYGAITRDGSGDGSPARAGYFLLRQREFLVPRSAGLAGSVVHDARDLDATWTAVLASWDAWGAALRAGTLMATGVDPKAPRPDGVVIQRDARCEWCDFFGICHVGDPA